MKPLQLMPLALTLSANAVHAGISQPPATTTHVVAVGQSLMDKAIRVRETAPANADVQAVAQAFQQHGARVHILAEEQLTRDALKSLLDEVAKAMKPEDSLVFYFSGFSGMAKDMPVLYVQGAGDKPEAALDGSRQIPLAELQGWLAATGALNLLMLLDTGPDAARFCGPWSKPGHIKALTAVCVDLPAAKPGEPGEFARTLAAGLQGPADANADHQYTGDELAGWVRAQLKGGAVVYQAGPVSWVLGMPLEKTAATVAKAVVQVATALPAPVAKPSGSTVTPMDKLDALLRAIVAQAGDAKAVDGLLDKDGIKECDGLVPVQIAVGNEADLPQVRQQVEKLGGKVQADVGKYLYARLAPAALQQLAACDSVWSMAVARPMAAPGR